MLYLSKVNIEKNTARAKHIRSLIIANKNISCPLSFLFYNFKTPLKNFSSLIIFLKNFIHKKETIYTRDIEFSAIATLFKVNNIYEIHHFGNVRSSTKFSFFNKILLSYLSKIKCVKFVTLTKSSLRVLKYLYPSISDERIIIIPDAGGLRPNTFTKFESKIIDKKGKLILSYAGSFLPGKGGLEVINLAKILKQYQFNIAGNIEKKIMDQILNFDNLHWKGYLDDFEILNFYEFSDILIAPIGERIFLDIDKKNEITFYTSPLKLYEYSFTNKPILTVDRPCTRVFRKMPGVWFIDKDKSYSPNAWIEAINQINEYLKSNNYRVNLLKPRKKYIYNWEERINEMINIK